MNIIAYYRSTHCVGGLGEYPPGNETRSLISTCTFVRLMHTLHQFLDMQCKAVHVHVHMNSLLHCELCTSVHSLFDMFAHTYNYVLMYSLSMQEAGTSQQY